MTNKRRICVRLDDTDLKTLDTQCGRNRTEKLETALGRLHHRVSLGRTEILAKVIHMAIPPSGPTQQYNFRISPLLYDWVKLNQINITNAIRHALYDKDNRHQ